MSPSNTKKVKSKVRAHLKEHWVEDGLCTVCGKNQWVVSAHEYELRRISSDTPGGVLTPTPLQSSIEQIADGGIPLCVVVCENCGLLNLFSSEHIRRASF